MLQYLLCHRIIFISVEFKQPYIGVCSAKNGNVFGWMGTCCYKLFFSPAFNTIMPDLLSDKLTQPSVPTSICQWITSFLTDRQQLMRPGKLTSRTLTISTGAPQGCVLSPLLFSLYTKLLHFKGYLCQAPEVCGLTLQSLASSRMVTSLPYRQEVKELAILCSLNNLELNTFQTAEMTVDFRRNPPALPPLPIITVLGTTIS